MGTLTSVPEESDSTLSENVTASSRVVIINEDQ